MPIPSCTARARSRGVALILSLVFLVILIGIGVFLAKRSNLELRMTGNAMEKARTFEEAEEARLAAEALASALADNLSAGGSFNCSAIGYFAPAGVTGTTGACKALAVKDIAWTNANSVVAGEGRYVIEYQGRRNIVLEEDRFTLPIKETEVHGFRIATRGAEESGGRTSVETVYLRRSSG